MSLDKKKKYTTRDFLKVNITRSYCENIFPK